MVKIGIFASIIDGRYIFQLMEYHHARDYSYHWDLCCMHADIRNPNQRRRHHSAHGTGGPAGTTRITLGAARQ
jgi:hypothetical protein